MDGERAGVHVTDRVDQAHHPSGPAHVQPGQRPGCAQAGKMEEGVAGEHPFALGHQPVVELYLLIRGRVQLIPHVGAAARRTKAGDAQCRAVVVGQGFEVVELTDIVARDDHGDFGVREARVGKVLQRADRHRE